jgi:ketosteroid isomerase-like protein
MVESPAAVRAWLRFCEGVSNGRVDEFDDIVSKDAKLIIGTAPGENVSDRAAMRYGFESEGVTLESRSAQGWEEGSLAWVVDEPRFGFPDGSAMDCRVTAVFRAEAGTWRLVHAHFSIGVPDDEVVELQRRWAAGS